MGRQWLRKFSLTVEFFKMLNTMCFTPGTWYFKWRSLFWSHENFQKSRESFYWKLLRSCVKKSFIQRHDCECRKEPKVREKNRFQYYSAGNFVDILILVISGILTRAFKEKRYIVVIINHCTKCPEAILFISSKNVNCVWNVRTELNIMF